ncbi:MAG: DUF2314 domain-containing protein [Cocleimonas sp.]|nr:DUF2314 domain-containing protein [Cocleimonas sp.]
MYYIIFVLIILFIGYLLFFNQKSSDSNVENKGKQDASSQHLADDKKNVNKVSNVKDESVEKGSDEELIPVFIPALSTILVAAEKKKGSPLTEEEVLSIRDNSQTIMTPKSMVDSLAESRGYDDINPEDCWNEWLLLRQQMGLEVEEDGGAIVLGTPSDNPDMRKAEKKARATLSNFRELIKQHEEINAMIKVKLEETNTSARMWLIVDKVYKDKFKAHLFETPSDFVEYQAGDSFTIKDEDIIDWMLNVDGDVYGAYTIREQRKAMASEEKKEMDEYMGVKNYK